MTFGLVPGPSVPLWKALLVFAVMTGVSFLFPRSRNKAREVILFCLLGFVLVAILWFARYL